MEQKKTYEELLEETKGLIKLQVDQLDALENPMVVQMASPDNYHKLEELILEIVISEKRTISDSIDQVERRYNPNKLED